MVKDVGEIVRDFYGEIISQKNLEGLRELKSRIDNFKLRPVDRAYLRNEIVYRAREIEKRGG